MAVHDQSEMGFSIPQGTWPWQPIFVGFYRKRPVAQPGGLSLGFSLRLVSPAADSTILFFAHQKF